MPTKKQVARIHGALNAGPLVGAPNGAMKTAPIKSPMPRPETPRSKLATFDPITQDSCYFYEDHTVITEQGGAVVLEISAGQEIAAKFPKGKAAIHQNHGLFTVSDTVDAAAFWFITMERSCQAQLMAEAAGTPKLIPHEMASYTRDLTGFPAAGWLQFQPLWEEICRTDPDLFD